MPGANRGLHLRLVTAALLEALTGRARQRRRLGRPPAALSSSQAATPQQRGHVGIGIRVPVLRAQDRHPRGNCAVGGAPQLT